MVVDVTLLERFAALPDDLQESILTDEWCEPYEVLDGTYSEDHLALVRFVYSRRQFEDVARCQTPLMIAEAIADHRERMDRRVGS